jgi:hypothetical protein
MTKKIRAAFLILSLIVSMISIFSVFDAPQKAQAGIECTLGPGNCGCLVSTDLCQNSSSWTYVGSYVYGCGDPKPFACNKSGMVIEDYQNGRRYVSLSGGITYCDDTPTCANAPTFSWCNPFNTCG